VGRGLYAIPGSSSSEHGSLAEVEIRTNANYAGVRVTLFGMIESARCQIPIGIGFGDAVTPAVEDADHPVMLLNFEAPNLRAYPRYTVVAEKFEALKNPGIADQGQNRAGATRVPTRAI